MDKTSRSIRRYHRARMLRRAILLYASWDDEPDMENVLWRAQQTYNNMAACSCSGCGNQRHNTWQKKEEQLTMQERRENHRYEYELKELEEEGIIEEC